MVHRVSLLYSYEISFGVRCRAPQVMSLRNKKRCTSTVTCVRALVVLVVSSLVLGSIGSAVVVHNIQR